MSNAAPNTINGGIGATRATPLRHGAAVLGDNDRGAIIEARGINNMGTGEGGRGREVDENLGVGQGRVIDV